MAALDNIASELLKSANEADLIYKRTRDQAQRDKAVRLRRIVENLKAISAGGLTPTLDEVLTEGNVSTNTLNVGGITSDYFQLDTAATPTPVQGMMFWDSDRSTVDVQLDADVSAKIGQDNFWYVKNQSGATIPKGKAVMAVGTLGASGRILIDEMVANGSISSKFLLGITAEDIANGADGFVMNIGKLRQVNTTIWPDGTVLYCDPTTAGNLTSTKPSSPNLALPVAFVVHSAVNGVLAIRVSILDENAFNTPTLAQVTTAGNTTTNAITVGGLTVATNLIYTDTVNSRVGFGTLTPFGKVDVKDGEIFVTTSTNANLRSRLTYQGLYISRASDGTYQEQIISTSSSWAYYSRNNHVFYRDGTAVLAVGQVGASAYMTINTTGNVLINTTTDAGYKLDVNGTARVNGRITAGNASTAGEIYSNPSVGMTFGSGQTTNTFTFIQINSGRFQPAGSVEQAHLLMIVGQAESSNQENRGSVIRHTGTVSTSSGNAIFSNFQTNNVINTTGGTTIYRGFYHNPTLTSLTGTTHRAIETTSGDVIINTQTATTNAGYTTMAIGGSSGVYFQMYVGPSPTSQSLRGQLWAVGNNLLLNNPGAGYLGLFTTLYSGITIWPTTGNVYVGASPSTDAGYKLDVAGTGRFTNNLSINKSYNLTWGTNQQINVTDYPSYFSGGYNVMSFISTSSGSYADDGSFVWRNAGTSKNLMVLTGVGNLGLGTTNPTDKIHIVDNTNGNKFARISAGGTDASAAWVAQNDQVDNIVYRVFGSAVTGSQMGQALARSASLIANLGGTGKFLIGSFSSTDLIFGTSDQARMRLVDATGNFLIGTMTDTGNKLTVSGNIDAQGYKVNNVLGYTGILNIPTNPPGQQNIDIQGGIVINIF